MNLYIETENGTTKNHPALEDNLIQAFGTVPSQWEPFIRVVRPSVGIYEVMSEDVTYEKVNGVWSDVWHKRDMTAEEKAAKQQATRDKFYLLYHVKDQPENWSTWTIDEATCIMVPPIPRPANDLSKLNAGISTMWCGADGNWKDTPVCPVVDCKFDFITWQWVEITAT